MYSWRRWRYWDVYLDFLLVAVVGLRSRVDGGLFHVTQAGQRLQWEASAATAQRAGDSHFLTQGGQTWTYEFVSSC